MLRIGESATVHGVTVRVLERVGETEAGGMMQMPPGADAPSNWLLYVMVEDVDATARRIAELGGALFVQPRDIPDVGRFGLCICYDSWFPETVFDCVPVFDSE